MIKHLLLITSVCAALTIYSQNQNLSNGFVFDGEPYLTINPNNSQHLVVSWLGFKLGNQTVIKIRSSFDAGQTWSTTTDIPHVVAGYRSADPSMAFDSNGDLFLCYIDYTPLPAAGAVYVVKSTNGGLTWGTPVEVINVNDDGNQQPVDRPWMVIDNSGGTNDGNIYVTTMNPNVFGPVPPPFNPYFIKSTDGGASFDPWRYLDTANWLAGSLIPQPMPSPCVSANGTFYAIYPSLVFTQVPAAQYILASSTSAGSTFNYNTAAAILTANTDTLPKKGYLLKSNPADANHLLLAYPNFDNGDLDVYIVESLNGGANWGTPIRINDDPINNDRMQDLIWADFDTDGDMVITWRDRRNANDSTYTVNSEIWGAIRWKDSTNFSANFPITDSSIAYNTVLAQAGNDFMGVNMINDTVYTVWGDTRNGFLNIWFQQLDVSSGASTVKDLNNNIEQISIYPNPSSNFVVLDFGTNELTNAHYEIYNVLGELITSKNVNQPKQQIDISKYTNGNYLLKFTNNKGSKAIKLIKK